MIGTYLVRFSTDLNETGMMVSGCVCSGNPRHHVHAEWQFAVPVEVSGLSLGAFKRFAIGAGDLAIVPPYTVHSEASVAESPTTWHVLFVTARTIERMRLAAGELPDQTRLSVGPVVHDPVRAEELRQLLNGSALGGTEEPEFLRRTQRWLTEVIHGHFKERYGMTPGAFKALTSHRRITGKPILVRQPEVAL